MEVSCDQIRCVPRTAEEKRRVRVGTADLLEMLLANEPSTDFSFCLGSDTFLDLTEWKWQRSRDVLTLLEGRLVVVNRPGVTESLRERVNIINKTENANVVLLDIPALREVSSTVARSCREEQKLRDLLSEGVVGFIKANKLYAFSDAASN